MKISIVIPNYNGEKIIRENLPKVFIAALEYKGNVEIIVTDDASTDESIGVLKETQKIVPKGILFSYIANKHNKGFAGNVNAGVNSAKGEIIFLLNTDVQPEKEFLNFLIPNFEDQGVFAVGCLDKSVENNSIVLRGNGAGQWKNGFLIHRPGEISRKYTLWASGGSSAFRKSFWDRLGGFNELYNPFYWEDIDLSYKAWKAGYKIMFERKSVVRHEHEKGSIKNYHNDSKIKLIAYRNQFLFVWLNITDANLVISHLMWLPIHFMRMFLSGEWIFFKGFFLALLKFPECLSYRSKYIKIYNRSDHDVLAQFN